MAIMVLGTLILSGADETTLGFGDLVDMLGLNLVIAATSARSASAWARC